MTWASSSGSSNSLGSASLGDPGYFKRLNATVRIKSSLGHCGLVHAFEYCNQGLTSFARPASTTYLILGMVMAVSATLVAITTKRMPGGGASKTFICFSVGKREYSGRI